MFLKNLKLTNFRNFKSLDLDLEQTTLLIGKNAQGKSNLLESIYFLATTKSLKAQRDSQLIKEDNEVNRVEGVVSNDVGEETLLEIVMQQNELGFFKKTLVNGVARRVNDYIGNLVVVYFIPEDINLISGPPSLRRWHIDLTLAQVDKEYKKAISNYTQIITNRNRVLKRIKEGSSKINELDFWNQEALQNGLVILDKRRQLFEFINSTQKILGQNFSFVYVPNYITPQSLSENLDREIASTNTLSGPHRDDFEFRLNDQDLAFFGSRGEQRTAILNLKLLELEYINHLTSSKPILLLDDIFSELDEDHKRYVISISKNQQTIISAVEGESIPSEFLDLVKVIKVKAGEITSWAD